MVQEANAMRAATSRVTGLSGSSSSSSSKRRKLKKTFDNIKMTLLCGLITILVLRGTLGIGNLNPSGSASDSDSKVLQDIDRILKEIRSDSESNSDYTADELAAAAANYNATMAAIAAENFAIGPKISDWDERRRQWLRQNPGFPSTTRGGKPRMLLVTGTPPGPCDNPLGDHYLLKSTKNKIDYCRLHGIEIVHNTALLDKDFTEYWAKIPLIRRLMLAHPEVEWFWWMDSDAMFTDMTFEIPMLKYVNHNLIVHGYPELIFEKQSWIGLNMGCYIIRNCQWTLDLFDAWAPMGPKGPIREEAGRLLSSKLKGRPAFEADDQSAFMYLLLTQRDKWADKVYIENSYFLHGYWAGLVDKYEEMMEKYHPGLGDERWPFITHFVGCKPCGSYGDYSVERCLKSMERAFNFADNQVLRLYGFAHTSLSSPKVKRVRKQTANPLASHD